MGRGDFFDARKPWGKYKHAILGKYLRIWVYKLSSRHRELAYVDACAGEGTYGDGVIGSPLLAAGWNDEFLLQRGRRLLVIACEKDPEAAEALAACLRSYMDREPPLARVYCDRFEHVLPQVFQHTHGMPCLFFIDPWGIKPLTRRKLKPLIDQERRAPTELLMRVDPIVLARLSGWWRRAARDSDPRWNKTAASMRQLTRDLGVDPAVVEQYAKGAASKGERVLPLFTSYLEQFRDSFRYIQAIPIRATSDGAPKYYLVHGTDSPHGFVYLNDAVSTTEDELFADTHDDGKQGHLFAPRRHPRHSIDDAVGFILERMEASPEAEWVLIDLRAELVRRFGSELRQKHHHAAVRRLIQKGRITASGQKLKDATRLWLTRGRSRARKAARRSGPAHVTR